MADLDDMGFSELCEALRREPLLSMSLGSKELFHSNLIVWFAEECRAVATAAFRPWTQPGPATHAKGHEREKDHLDAILRFDGLQPIVIENKMFSVPDQAQLKCYANKLHGDLERCPRVLLTLIEPGFDPDGWQVKSYSELADAIEDKLNGLDEREFPTQVLRHYIRFIRILSRVMETVGTPSTAEPLPLPPDQADLLHGIRMDAAVQKARASWVTAQIRGQLGDDSKEVRVNSGFTNGRALIEGFCPVPGTAPPWKKDDVDNHDLVGWQLQGEQFRLAVVTYKFEHPSSTRQDRESYVHTTYNDWFTFDQYAAITDRIASPAPTRRRQGQEPLFQAYDPTFSYRYVPCNALSVDEIIRLGVAYSRAALARAHRQQGSS